MLAPSIEADLPDGLDRPSGVDVLSGRPVRFVGRDLPSALARLARLLLGFRIALLGRRDERGDDDPTRHRGGAVLLQLPAESLHHSSQGGGLGQFVAKQTDGVLAGVGAPRSNFRNRIRYRRSRIMNSIFASPRSCRT